MDVTELFTDLDETTLEMKTETDEFTTMDEIFPSGNFYRGNESTTLSALHSLSTEITSEKKEEPDCRLPGVLYRGNKNMTITGRACQMWVNQSPHEHNYDVFSLAQENYCRNFDREEPWCYTTDRRVRWELCDVKVCGTPCLNQSFYSFEVIKQCYWGNNQKTDCESISKLGLCLKNHIELSSGVKCPEVKVRSILLQSQSMIEKIIGKSISVCVRSPCTDPDYADAVKLIKYADPCLKRFPIFNMTLDASMDHLCRTAVAISNCVLATVTEETDSTCLSKDKVLIANNFMNLIPRPFQTKIQFCIENNFTEFYSADIEGEIQDSTENISQTLIFLLVGFAFFLLFLAILTISLVKMRAMLLKKRRKELMRLPSVPKTVIPQYETTFVVSDGLYLDPDYEVIEEIDEGYERLPEPNMENTEQRESNIERSYTLPTNPEGSYLDVVHVNKNVIDYINIHPYTELVNDSEDNTSTVDDQLFQRKNGENLGKIGTITEPHGEKQY